MNMHVLIDNSLFAGFMREYLPDLPAHRDYLSKYPDHKAIDVNSAAQFLNALAMFDYPVIEAEPEQYLDNNDVQRQRGWVDNLRCQLPQPTRDLISVVDELYNGNSNLFSDRGILASLDIYGSSLAAHQNLYVDGHIPYSYSSPDYAYRARFNKLIEENGIAIDERSLQHAMFLHRGIRLQASAARLDAIYQPYWYRADILARTSPLLSLPPLDDGLVTVRLFNQSRSNTEKIRYIQELSKVYYDVLHACRFVESQHSFPFLGGAILDMAHGNMTKALELALEFRTTFKDRARWKELMAAVDGDDKPLADDIAEEITNDIRNAGALGRVDEFSAAELFGIPQLNRA